MKISVILILVGLTVMASARSLARTAYGEQKE